MNVCKIKGNLNIYCVFLQENMMTASNLAICIGQSVLWSNDSSVVMDQNYSKNISSVIQILIEHYVNIYGDVIPFLFSTEKRGSADSDGKPTFVKGPNASKSNNILLQRSHGKSKYFEDRCHQWSTQPNHSHGR